ncbi:hypothetical protein [Brumimicrobium mesophilum]|uniref:hypothetical protein n=1 Tax=Brumimicrobium mesophilum TaxID=392717 RepID=UPI00131ECBC1|nr:hypothetical protein [Brumimicrobium mesophilum]
MSKFYPLFTWVIFGLLILYLLLRAYFLEPLHDEAATFFHYIESGSIWGENMMLDANNHLLNSAICHLIYLIFGEHFFFLRLPNVFAFAFYFWGIYRFIKPIGSSLYKSFILLGTTCIPFILEYFAYTRGYGISIGLFVFSLHYIRNFIESKSIKSAYISSLLLCIAVYANLNFILTLILMALLFVLIQWMYKEAFSRKQHFLLFLNYALLGVLNLPNLYYAHILRANGALYYGSLDGFWEVTGKTLAKYTIFHDLVWLKYGSLIIIALLIFYFIKRWIKLGAFNFFSESSTVLAWFLFGNCIAILLMAKVLGVNYPEDRVGMHLVILFLLMMGFVLNQIKKISWLMVVMLFFPITMIPRINLSTSVFSPDDRISKSFFNQVVKELDPYTTISIYPIQQLTWAYLSRGLESDNFMISQRDFNRTSEIVFTKSTLFSDQEFLDDYNVIAHNPLATHVAYKRKSLYLKKLIFQKSVNVRNSKENYILIFKSIIPDSLRNRKLQFHFHADMEADNTYREFASFNFNIIDNSSNSLDYRFHNLRWNKGTRKSFPVNFNYAIEQLDANANEISLYIRNRKNENFSIKNGSFEILELLDI